MEDAIETRNQRYNSELARQRANDALCKQFADSATAFSEWMSGNSSGFPFSHSCYKGQMSKIRKSTQTEEEQLRYVDERIAHSKTEGEKMPVITELDKTIKEKGISNNRFNGMCCTHCGSGTPLYLSLM